MVRIPVEVARYARDLYSVVSSEELEGLGISRQQRGRMIAAGALIPVYRGVYRLASARLSHEARCRAICLSVPSAVITGRAAGRLWDLRLMGRGPHIEVRVPHFAHSFDDPKVIERRCNALDPGDVVDRADGIRLVRPFRLAFDLAAVLTHLDLESVIEQMLDRNLCTVPALMEAGRRLAHPARPGSRRFAEVIGSRPAWLKPADSHLEVRLFDALRAAGVGGLVRQFELALPGGWAIHADVAVPALKWAIPVDHVTWHGGRVDAQRDKQNDRQARMIGWQVDRVTDDDIEHRLAATAAELSAIYAVLRAAAPRP